MRLLTLATVQGSDVCSIISFVVACLLPLWLNSFVFRYKKLSLYE